MLAVFALALVLLGPAWAGDGDLDPNFNPGVGVNSVPILWTQVFYNDTSGKTMVGGSFTEVGDVANRAIARLDLNGNRDPSFTSPVTTGWVNNCFLLNPSLANNQSQILIAGNFTISHPDGDYYGLARLNWDGSVDTSFARTFGPCPGMSGFAVQTVIEGGVSKTKILVCGYALPVNGDLDNTYYYLRLNADGTVDNTYPKRSAPGGFVRGVGVNTTTNEVRLTGCFPRFSDPTHLDYMVLLDSSGANVLSRLGDEDVNGTILNMAFQGDDKIVIVGNFTQVLGATMNGVARLVPGVAPDPPFSLDGEFNQITTGANGFVQRVNLDTGNKPVLAGYFTSFNGTPCGYMVRLNYDGSVDNNFNTDKIGADDRIWTMFKRGDGTWIIEGAFQAVHGQPRKCIANLAADGTLNSQYASFNLTNTGKGTVYAIQDSPQGLYVGGAFSGFGGKYHARLARLNFNGPPNPAFRTWTDGTVRAIRFQWSDGKLLVAGNFGTVYGYTPRTGLARFNLDGSLDRAFNPVILKADGSFPDLAMVDVQDDDGTILIAGDFAQIADASHVMKPRSGLARLNADGTLDPSFNAQINIPGGSNIRVNGAGNMGGLYPMAGYVFYDNKAAGFYTRLTSTGALDTSFGPPGGPAPHVNLFNGEARCGDGRDDGKVLIGGDFTAMIDGSDTPVGRIARFTPDGLLDTTFAATPGADNPIYVMERQWPGGKIFIGGAFTSYNGEVRNRVARLNPDGSLDTIFNPGTGADGPVYALNWNDYIRRLRIGGGFTTYQDVSRPGIAQIKASRGSIEPVLLLLLKN